MNNPRHLAAARNLLEHVGQHVETGLSVKLWDGSIVPVGQDPIPGLHVVIRDAGVLGSLLRRPSLERLLQQYVTAGIDFEGADLVTLINTARERRTRHWQRRLEKPYLLRQALSLIAARSPTRADGLRYAGDDTGRATAKRDEKHFVQFHYDVSNEFYSLFLDPEMQYSCGYFRSWENSLEQAQQDKLDMICRKLRLAPGERMLDIGCGWGGLLVYAAQKYGIEGHGVTLSERQYEFALEKVRRFGLEDRVRLELRDYRELSGEYDKIASIGMYEHVGLANMEEYFRKVRSLMRDRGVFLNHGITRRAKRSKRRFHRISPGRRVILKYVFPGSDLDHVGSSVAHLEASGFEVHDVEGWREHYARTTELWSQRLEARREEAIEHVGEDRYRMWVAYLAAVSVSFTDGSLRIFQTVATKHKAKGVSGMPPTREDLYAR
jgi:cyclopropane-fatty-acyl-phospholipid synthase